MTTSFASAATGALTPAEVGARKGIVVFSMFSGAQDYTIEPKPDGTGYVRKYKIFKAGSFADSTGERRTWTAEHLALMVQNFDLLRQNAIFPNVPVRSDHTKSVDSLAGYFDALSSDEDWLYQDIDFTEPDKFGKFQRGTYRGRSLEVGFYEANDGALYWPVVMGSAFVDIPAVEGLYAKQNLVLINTDKETAPVQTATFRVNGGDVTDAAVVQAHITTLEAAAAKAPQTFRVNGAEVSDFAAVQTHITALETAADESRTATRQAFVKQLVTDRKLTAPQEAVFAEMAVDMTDARYAKFVTSFEGAPVVPILQKHGQTITNPDGGEVSADEDALAVATETVAMHRRGGMTEAQIAATPSGKRLIAAAGK